MSLDRNRGFKRAREARKALGLDPQAPVPCLLDCVEEEAGVPVVIAPLADGVAGACTKGPLLWVNGTDAKVRQRFTLAHELGHVRCQHDAHAVVDTWETLSGRTTNSQEVQANAFAAEFLVPRVALEELAGPGDPTLDEVVLVAARFGTSAIMTLYRFTQHGLASDACRETIAAQIAEREHQAAWLRLGCEPIADRLGAMEDLPYLSPPVANSRLGAVLRGDAAAEPRLAAAISRLL